FCAKIKTMEKGNLINEKTIEYLSELSRIKLTPAEKQRFEKDLNAILDYVNQLQAVDTASINLDEELLKIKTDLEAAEKTEKEKLSFERDDLIDGFYDRKEDWLKIPPIF
ncbi:MAG TPA: Asp-tRNA(Asn)/Glu-tRNA(Gln) amidotransferase subunit GatC, partial [Candidatus Paceibacterota bacterium]|nr:Asp-tRNA(Asn)/Glu-tRNA(Gln) amidotransferase subunit GatC [Candidatus Paceibacterota bacterium]HOL53983.1 Asp-tRNA(Asn)/Glu-tRNA(Gln) amidotransferase subunit GatC [Candidatus Paceibacterota bacterium]HON21989.1 Asp-tRNA(Asn)/Glu-tRNA(Gln) amidotransferase subunit GatC [Candidatus Paceibacterota bacterium]